MDIRETTLVPAVSLAKDLATLRRAVPEHPQVSAAVAELPPAQVLPQQSLQLTMQAVVEQVQAYLRSVDREVEFSIDSGSGQSVVRVRDGATGEVIRQLPTEEALRMLQRLYASSGTLLDRLA
jgi:flagellar protein FlaG